MARGQRRDGRSRPRARLGGDAARAREGWPQSLRTAVDTCLGSGFASFVWWGRDLVQVYNDAALSIVRAKHPAAFGAPARRAWSDAWEVVGPLVERVLGTGKPELGEDMPMVPERGGPPKEAYFTFSYSALRDEAGSVTGMLITAIETTERVLLDRRREQAEEELRERRRGLGSPWRPRIWGAGSWSLRPGNSTPPPSATAILGCRRRATHP